MNKLLWTFIQKSLSRHMFPFLFSKNPELGFGSYCRSMVNSKETAKLISKIIVPFYTPPPTYESSSFSSLMSTLEIFSLLNFHHSTDIVLPHCGLCWISLMINAVELIFLSPFGISVSLNGQIFSLFFMELFVFLLCSCKSFLYILDISPFWDDMYCKYFLPAWFIFNFLNIVSFKG